MQDRTIGKTTLQTAAKKTTQATEMSMMNNEDEEKQMKMTNTTE